MFQDTIRLVNTCARIPHVDRSEQISLPFNGNFLNFNIWVQILQDVPTIICCLIRTRRATTSEWLFAVRWIFVLLTEPASSNNSSMLKLWKLLNAQELHTLTVDDYHVSIEAGWLCNLRIELVTAPLLQCSPVFRVCVWSRGKFGQITYCGNPSK